MKLKIIILSTILSTLAIYSCNNNDKKISETAVIKDTITSTQTPMTDVARQASKEGNAVIITSTEVPDTIRNTFTTKYPKGKKIEWYKYEPVAEDELVMDDSYYYVRFNDNGADYTTWYNNKGEWIKTATKVQGNKNLPDAVNMYINTNYPDYTIEEINKENDKDMDMFEIKMNKGDSKVKLKILPNGKVFKKKSN